MNGNGEVSWYEIQMERARKGVAFLLNDVWHSAVILVNVGASKVMVLSGEEGLECEVYIDRIHLEHVSEFKYLGCVLDESGTDEAKCSRKVVSWKSVAGAIRSLVNARSL